MCVCVCMFVCVCIYLYLSIYLIKTTLNRLMHVRAEKTCEININKQNTGKVLWRVEHPVFRTVSFFEINFKRSRISEELQRFIYFNVKKSELSSTDEKRGVIWALYVNMNWWKGVRKREGTSNGLRRNRKRQ